MFLILRPEQQDAFFPVQPRLPFLGSFKAALSFSSAFPAFSHLFPTTPLHWGNLDFSSNLNQFLSRIFERFWGFVALSILMDLASDLQFSFWSKCTIILFISSNKICKYIHTIVIPWGPPPQDLKFKCLTFKIQHTNWGCYTNVIELLT